MRIIGQESIGFRIQIREIASAAARDPNFFARFSRVIDDEGVWACVGGAHHARCTSTDDYGFEMTSHDLTFIFSPERGMREAFWPLNTPFCAGCLEIITERAHYIVSLSLSYPVV